MNMTVVPFVQRSTFCVPSYSGKRYKESKEFLELNRDAIEKECISQLYLKIAWKLQKIIMFNQILSKNGQKL